MHLELLTSLLLADPHFPQKRLRPDGVIKICTILTQSFPYNSIRFHLKVCLYQNSPKFVKYYCHICNVVVIKIFQNSPIWSHCNCNINTNFWMTIMSHALTDHFLNRWSSNRLLAADDGRGWGQERQPQDHLRWGDHGKRLRLHPSRVGNPSGAYSIKLFALKF